MRVAATRPSWRRGDGALRRMSPRGVARAQCVARDASRRDSRAHARAAMLARAAGDRPRLPREHHDDDRDHESRRRARRPPPFVAPSTKPSPSRRATRSRRRLRSRNARARGRGCERALSDVGATLADELLWMSDQDAGSFGVVYAPSPTTPTETPPTPPTNLLPLLPHLLLPLPLRFPRARTPDVSAAPSPSTGPRYSANPNRRSSGRRARLSPRRRRRAPPPPSPSSPSAWAGTAGRSVTIEPSPTSRRTVSSSYRPPSPIVAPTPRPSASSPTTSARVSIGPRARRVDRTHPCSVRSIHPDADCSVIPAARARRRARAATDATLAAGPGPRPRTLAPPAWAPSRPAPASTSTR